jgi:hypothetical protein
MVSAMEGTVYNVTTPCEIERMWPLPTGLLLERARLPKHDDPLSPAALGSKHRSPNSYASMSTRTGSPSQLQFNEYELPTLFSLLHPLDELKPVSFIDQSQMPRDAKKPDPTTPSKPSMGPEPTGLNTTMDMSETSTSMVQFPEDLFVCQPDMHLVFSTGDVALMVIFDDRNGRHSVWLLRQQERDEDSVSYELAKRQRAEAARLHRGGLDTSFPSSPGGVMMMGRAHEPNILTALGLGSSVEAIMIICLSARFLRG